jgi:DNA-dependent protein kinase catalytic subunit
MPCILNLIRTEFSRRHAKRLLDICGQEWPTCPDVDMLKMVVAYFEKMDKPTEQADRFLLSDYSPWLAQFSCYDSDTQLELPGQVNVWTKPPQESLYITSFHPSGQTLASIRRPKRIRILGSDGKEYSWLIKVM